MTPQEWKSHKADVCESCRHSRRGRCEAMMAQELDPANPMSAFLFRSGRCSQFEARPATERGR